MYDTVTLAPFLTKIKHLFFLLSLVPEGLLRFTPKIQPFIPAAAQDTPILLTKKFFTIKWGHSPEAFVLNG